jgi:hypothetical protein
MVVSMPNNNSEPVVNVVSKVKGPIRCHKCQLKCRDAEHYLSHKCEPASSPDCSAAPSFASLRNRG